MSNRSQRRIADKVMNHPEIKKQTEKFAQELADLLMEHFEQNKDNPEQLLNFNEITQQKLKNKGKELFNIATDTFQNSNFKLYKK